MKTIITNIRYIVSIFSLTLLLSFTLPLYPVFASELQPVIGADFEFGTQFGITHITPDDEDLDSSVTLTHIPTSFAYIGASPTSLYFTWYPISHVAIGPELSYGRMTVTDEYWDDTETSSLTSLYFGGRVAISLLKYSVSTPYILARMSFTIVDDDDTLLFGDSDTITSFGLGIGYQFRLGASFVLRTEAQYQRLTIEEEHANEYALIIGIGTRFGR